MKRLISIVAITAAFMYIACAGTQPTKEPVSNNTLTASGDTVWTSDNFNGKVQIDKAFKFLGSQSTSSQRSIRKNYVWQKDSNCFLYIVDWTTRGSWSFPEDQDGLLGQKNDPKNPNLLAYEPGQYSIWDKMGDKSKTVALALGVQISKCYVAIEKVKMSEKRNAAFWVILVENSNCNKNFDGLQRRLDEAIEM